jgi:hypothetical protein
MANLPESATYDAGVIQLETDTPATGGPDGQANAPLRNLANRTAYLKQHLDSLEAEAEGLAPINSPGFTGTPTAPTPALGDNDESIATSEFVQKTLGGYLSKSVAGGATVTLTPVEAGNGIIELTGLLTDNIDVILPATPTRSWVVRNSTTGDFYLNVKTASGTGVFVTRGVASEVYSNGTNILNVKGIETGNNVSVTVGTGGDFSTLNSAIEYLSRRYQPIYKKAGVKATINMLAGFVMAEQVLVHGLDLSWITIDGADVQTTITHTALTTNFSLADYGFNAYPAFGVSKGGALPKIAALFIFSASGVLGDKHGILAVGAGSRAEIAPNCGVKNAGSHGIAASHGAIINAYQANVSGAGENGIHAAHGAVVNALEVDASNCLINGVNAVYGAVVDVGGGNMSGADHYGIYAISSIVEASSANVSGAGQIGISSNQGAHVNAQSAIATGCTESGIAGIAGGHVNAHSANARRGVSDSPDDIKISSGGVVVSFNGTGGTSNTVNTLTSNGIIYR